MRALEQVYALCLLAIAGKFAAAVELTFELADNAKECFYQEIDKDVAVTLEFQVCRRASGPAAPIAITRSRTTAELYHRRL